LIRINATTGPPADDAGVGGSSVASQEAQFGAGAPVGPSARKVPLTDPSFCPLPYSESEFLIQLGTRVRAMRVKRDMSRRELARRSGISERYIAEIEKGRGNVSIVLLLRIAHAVRSEP
jgi:DNA-binding XRE family transcriptional regulator